MVNSVNTEYIRFVNVENNDCWIRNYERWRSIDNWLLNNWLQFDENCERRQRTVNLRCEHQIPVWFCIVLVLLYNILGNKCLLCYKVSYSMLVRSVLLITWLLILSLMCRDIIILMHDILVPKKYEIIQHRTNSIWLIKMLVSLLITVVQSTNRCRWNVFDLLLSWALLNQCCLGVASFLFNAPTTILEV
jgi:hypothetical protein